jgi:hypothetical protein
LPCFAKQKEGVPVTHPCLISNFYTVTVCNETGQQYITLYSLSMEYAKERGEDITKPEIPEPWGQQVQEV